MHGIFASQDVTSTPSGSENDIVPFNPKHVVMEVFGPPGTVATVTYLDVNAQPQHADAVTLPWAYDTTTTQPAVFVNVSAQGNSDSIGCRIKIDDAVKDERSVNTLNARSAFAGRIGLRCVRVVHIYLLNVLAYYEVQIISLRRIGKTLTIRKLSHDLDNPYSRRSLHRPGDQRLSAG